MSTQNGYRLAGAVVIGLVLWLAAVAAIEDRGSTERIVEVRIERTR